MYSLTQVELGNAVHVLLNRVGAAVLLIGMSSQIVACGSAIDTESGEAEVGSTSEALVGFADARAFGCAEGQNFIYLSSNSPSYGCRAYDNGDMWCAIINGIGGTSLRVERVEDGQGHPTGQIALNQPISRVQWSNRYVSADNGGGGGIHANRTGIGNWESFTVEKLAGYQRYALRTSNGSYVTAENGGGSVMNANRPSPGAWETFQVGCSTQ